MMKICLLMNVTFNRHSNVLDDNIRPLGDDVDVAAIQGGEQMLYGNSTLCGFYGFLDVMTLSINSFVRLQES